MFEKDAEEYFRDNARNFDEVTACRECMEYGYNKANEWHCVKDELPPEDVPLLCLRGGKIYVAWYYNSIYHDNRCCQVQKPYAWKEIVLPELKGE